MPVSMAAAPKINAGCFVLSANRLTARDPSAKPIRKTPSIAEKE